MRIDSASSANPVQPAKSKNLGGLDPAAGVSGVDSVHLSSLVEDIKTAMDALKSEPDVREEHVADLRSQIESGTFDPNVDAMVDRLFDKK